MNMLTQLSSAAGALTLALTLAVPAQGASAQPRSNLLQTDFPFTTACIGAKWPEKNIAYKGMAIRLGDNAAVAFDTDLLRYTAGWTGGYIRAHGVAFDGAHGGYPTIEGEQAFGTRQSPGWADKNGQFNDPRTEPYGPLPQEWARWDGAYVVGMNVVLSYTVHGSKVYEQASRVESNGQTGFARTFRVEKAQAPLTALICDAQGAGEVKENVATLVSGDSVTKVALVGAPKNAKLEILDGGRVVLRLPKGSNKSDFATVLWNGAKTNEAAFAALTKSVPPIADFKKGGSPRWPEPVITKGVVGPGEGAYVVDTLTPPTDNPWKRRVRFGGFDFFKDGKRAAFCTWDGDIWILSGIDDKLENLQWRRFASGGYETLGLKIVDDVIYTSGRDQITRYHDTNKDGEADYYENFNNQLTSSQGFHEFVFDLQTDKQGNFYFAKAGPVRGGGRGFGGGGGNGEITAHAGSLLKVSKDGKKLSVYATGFRAPNGIGVGPDGQVTTGDNEGTWIPACPLNWVKEGGFYGVEDLAHKNPVPEFNQPVLWMSHNEFDNSGGGQVWVTSDKWGPYKGELLHLSYGQCALYHVMKQNLGSGKLQGAVVKFPVSFSSSAMRGKFNPADGQLYVAGLQGWQTKAAKITGFDRVRYTGKPTYTVQNVAVNREGIHLTFSQPLDEETAKDPQNYSAKRWNYKRSSDYGSGQFSVANPQKRGQDTVEITEAKLSSDGKRVTLKVADLAPVMQMQIKFMLKAKDGTPIEQQTLQTIHEVPDVGIAAK
ncbi:MAG TPA: DUF6797 domain-containing protein [Methylomirabilota bacterium]|nr:DUF6797 domain-containing protein [Methylomirabilota bacterium]